jgi:hypothetical protein
MAKPMSSFRTPGTVWPCHTSIGLVVLRGASEVSICQRWRYHAARSATRELSASRSVVTRVIWRVRKPGVPIWSRTSRSTHAAGRAANASRASHEGPVCGVTQVTRGVWTPRAVRQRARGRPLTDGVRWTPGMTKGRPGVKSTMTSGSPARLRRRRPDRPTRGKSAEPRGTDPSTMASRPRIGSAAPCTT